MSRSVFVSYNHRQADWVHDRLVPVLKAGVQRVDVDLPELIRRGEPLYANLVDEALLERALSRAVVRGNNVLIELLEKESRLPGEWDYLRAFRGAEEQDVPEDEAVARSLRRRRLVEEDGGRFRLRVPLMAQWLRERI